ncbi:MAG: hypothetical protein ACI4I8_07090, partial [Oscillospiraceae bacterium]
SYSFYIAIRLIFLHQMQSNGLDAWRSYYDWSHLAYFPVYNGAGAAKQKASLRHPYRAECIASLFITWVHCESHSNILSCNGKLSFASFDTNLLDMRSFGE